LENLGRFLRDFANNILSPILKSSPAAKNLLLMGHDDNRNYILDAAHKVGILIIEFNKKFIFADFWK